MSRYIDLTCASGMSPYAHMSGHTRYLPWIEGLHDPPECHGKPMVTHGGLRMLSLERAIRENGDLPAECRVDGLGAGQSAWCHPHGWSGVVQDCEHRGEDSGYSQYRCPNWRIAQWMRRRWERAA